MKIVQFTVPVAGEHSVVVQEDVLPHFYDHLHRHKETQITWIQEGEGTLLAGDYMQRFKSGDIYIFGPNQPHLFRSDPSYFEKRKLKTVRSISLFFDALGVFGPVLALPELKNVQKFLATSSGGLQATSMAAQLQRAMLRVSEQSMALRLACFIELLQFMASMKKWKTLATITDPYSISESEGLRMNDVYQYTMQHYTENISLAEIASIAHLTPQAFCRYFKKHTRKTYVSFLNEIRITEACKKMVKGDFDSFSSIAYQAGFNNVVTFNRVFKKTTGHAPREYLRAYRGKAESDSG
ncbi:MAG: helix-turn-helix transcriptional regulator [Chitinophagaceae bacterium]|nr:helix-turn-helix transcriptional regulator [Chitinophagaceae bacterium]